MLDESVGRAEGRGAVGRVVGRPVGRVVGVNGRDVEAGAVGEFVGLAVVS